MPRTAPSNPEISPPKLASPPPVETPTPATEIAATVSSPKPTMEIFTTRGIRFQKGLRERWETWLMRDYVDLPRPLAESIEDKIFQIENILAEYDALYAKQGVAFTRRDEFLQILARETFSPSPWADFPDYIVIKASQTDDWIDKTVQRQCHDIKHLLPEHYEYDSENEVQTRRVYASLFVSSSYPINDKVSGEWNDLALLYARRLGLYLRILPSPEDRLRYLKTLSEKDTSFDTFEQSMREAANALAFPEPPTFHLKGTIDPYVQTAALLTYDERPFVLETPEQGTTLAEAPLTAPQAQAVLNQVMEQLKILHRHDFRLNALQDVRITILGDDVHASLALSPRNPHPIVDEQFNALVKLGSVLSDRGITLRDIARHRTSLLAKSTRQSPEAIASYLERLDAVAGNALSEAVDLLEYHLANEASFDRNTERKRAYLEEFLTQLTSVKPENRKAVILALFEHRKLFAPDVMEIFFALAQHFPKEKLPAALTKCLVVPCKYSGQRYRPNTLVLGRLLAVEDPNFQNQLDHLFEMVESEFFTEILDETLIKFYSEEGSAALFPSFEIAIEIFHKLNSEFQTKEIYLYLFDHCLPNIDFSYSIEKIEADLRQFGAVGFDHYLIGELESRIPELGDLRKAIPEKKRPEVWDFILRKIVPTHSFATISNQLRVATAIFQKYPRHGLLLYRSLDVAAHCKLIPATFEPVEILPSYLFELDRFLSMKKQGVQEEAFDIFLEILPELGKGLVHASGHLRFMTQVFEEFPLEGLDLYKELERAVRVGWAVDPKNEFVGRRRLFPNFEFLGEHLWDFIRGTQGFNARLYALYFASANQQEWLRALIGHREAAFQDSLAPHDLQRLIDAQGDDYALGVLHSTNIANSEHFLGAYAAQKELMHRGITDGDLRHDIPRELGGAPLPFAIAQGAWKIKAPLHETGWKHFEKGLAPIDRKQIESFRQDLLQDISTRQSAPQETPEEGTRWDFVEKLIRYAQAANAITATTALEALQRERHHQAHGIILEWFKEGDRLPKLLRDLVASPGFPRALFAENSGVEITPKAARRIIGQILALDDSSAPDKPHRLSQMLRALKASEIREKILAHPEIRARLQLVSTINADLLRRSPPAAPIADGLLAPIKDWLEEEDKKFEFKDSGGDLLELQLRFVKGVAHALHGRGTGACNSKRKRQWRNRKFLLLAIQDPKAKKTYGYFYILLSRRNLKDHLIVASINPADRLLERVDAKKFFTASMAALRKKSQAVGYFGIDIVTNENVRTNRPPLQPVIANDLAEKTGKDPQAMRSLSPATEWDWNEGEDGFAEHPLRQVYCFWKQRRRKARSSK